MRLVFIFFIVFVSIHDAAAQFAPGKIELNVFARRDYYPEWEHFINPTIKNTTKITGTSWGANIGYKAPLVNNFWLTGQLGYYRYSFNNIDNNHPMFGKTKSRVTEYESPSNRLLYATDKYWYNTLSATVSVEKSLFISNRLDINPGLLLTNYFTFSQTYHIGDNEVYKPKDFRYFGLSVAAQVTFAYKFKRMTVGPTVILPLFDSYRQDKIFPGEQDNASRSKWFRGVGIGLSCTYSLKK